MLLREPDVRPAPISSRQPPTFFFSGGNNIKHGLPAFVVPAAFAFATLANAPAVADILLSVPNGYDEVPTLSSPARADFRARLNEDEIEIEYRLSYSGFPTPLTQAHIHFGRAGFNGGVMVFLCSNLGNAPAGTPTCPATEGTVTGTLTAANMVGGAATQGIAAGEFAEMVDAIRAGATYVNLHTEQFPAGEIRDQVKALGFPHQR